MRQAKLSDADREEIRTLHSNGSSISSLAKTYCVSAQTIRRVVDPEVYAKHLERVSKYNTKNATRIQERHSQNFRRISFSLHRVTDAQVIEVLNGQENITQYIRDLIIKDIEKNSPAAGLDN